MESYVSYVYRKLLAEASLRELEFEMAEKAFVKCEDYHGIQFVKQLHHLNVYNYSNYRFTYVCNTSLPPILPPSLPPSSFHTCLPLLFLPSLPPSLRPSLPPSLSLPKQSVDKQRAQIAAYFREFDTAEKMYLELDCHNLAVDLRVKLGDWFKVVRLLEKGGGAGGCGFH